MGQEDNRFQPGGEPSDAMLRRLRDQFCVPPLPDTTLIEDFLGGLDLSKLDATSSTFPQPVPPSTPNGDVVANKLRHGHPEKGEKPSNAEPFPFPPGLSMIWKVTQSDSNPNFVIQRPSTDTEEKITVLAVTSRLDYTNPRFSVPEAPNFQVAVSILIPHILNRIPKPKSVSQQAFDKAITVIQENLAIIAPMLTYSNDGQKDRFIAEENHQPASIALDHIALALSSIASSETQMQDITRALQADLLALY